MSKPVPAAPWTRLFVFISIQCFFSVFISKVPSCICQLQWKARDTTESGSRFNRFHAISTALRGVCLPLAEERLSHTSGCSSSWYSSTLPVLKTGGEWGCRFLFPSIPHCPPAYAHSMTAFLENWQQRGPDEVRCNLLGLEKVRCLCAKHTLCASRRTYKQHS